VLPEVARGLSNAEVAERLHMSAATAKTHVSRLLTKLAARDRSQLVVAAYESGFACAPAVAGKDAARRPPILIPATASRINAAADCPSQ
jgi:hypothetical protein